jgi:hypothetical protein
LQPLDARALRSALRPIHDLLQRADARTTLALLDSEPNAYRNGLQSCTPSMQWVSKLDNLHASVGKHGKAVKAAVQSGAVMRGSPVAIGQASHYRGWETHAGHGNTATPLLCYATAPGKAWITVHLDPAAFQGMRPHDEWYYHVSIAVLEDTPKPKCATNSASMARAGTAPNAASHTRDGGRRTWIPTGWSVRTVGRREGPGGRGRRGERREEGGFSARGTIELLTWNSGTAAASATRAEAKEGEFGEAEGPLDLQAAGVKKDSIAPFSLSDWFMAACAGAGVEQQVTLRRFVVNVIVLRKCSFFLFSFLPRFVEA